MERREFSQREFERLVKIEESLIEAKKESDERLMSVNGKINAMFPNDPPELEKIAEELQRISVTFYKILKPQHENN